MMKKTEINTQIGQIAVYINDNLSQKTPIIFLHGVYFDHHLWDEQITLINDRKVIVLDMPLHGESKIGFTKSWNLDDCAAMLIEILEKLDINKVIAIGHSWGSMTILRAAHKNPSYFSAIGLCNMPFRALPKTQKILIRLQHLAIFFKKFYIKQAGNALFGKNQLLKRPFIVKILSDSMNKLENDEIKYIDKVVRIDAEDTTSLLKTIKMPIYALIGAEDYVGNPPIDNVQVVEGGHVSPIEVPEDVNNFINQIIQFSE